jgi:hypothetical protein
MNTSRRPVLGLAVLSAFVVALADGTPAQAQKQQPGQPKPEAPVLKSAAPYGMKRGTTLDLTLTGTNLNDPTGVWTSFPAKVTIPTDGNNGKDATKLLVKIEVPPDAPLGFHTIRLATARGMSNVRIFCLDDLPEVASNNANRSKATAQPVTAPAVVFGRVTAEASDYYKITATAGQRLTFEVLGRRLGSAFDPQLTLFDPKTGREVPNGHSNDAPGLQTDPRLTHVFKEAGDYLLELRDVSYRGGEDFAYRLRIGDFPCATTTLPMAAKRGSKVSVQFAGPQVEGVTPVEVTVPPAGVEGVYVTPKGPSGLPGWPVLLSVSDLDETMEQEPNNELAKANRVPVPGAVTGRFQEKGDVDYYIFSLKKGQRVFIDGHTAEMGSPAEVYMVLRDAKGTQLLTTNPAMAPRIDFNPTADGDYTLSVEHLLYNFGPSETYRVTITPYEPGFDLALQLDRYDVAQDGTVTVPVVVTRRDYTGPIDLFVDGVPGLSAAQNVAAGQPMPPNQPVQLAIKAAETVPVGPHVFAVKGKASINGKEVVVTASVRGPLSASLAGLPIPPRESFTSVGLAVTERAPFTLAAKFDEAAAMPGKPTTLTVTLTRTAGFNGEVALTLAGLPANVTAMPKPIPPNMNEEKVTLTLAGNAAVGSFPITVTGKSKHNGRDVTVNAAPVPLMVKK